MATHLKSFFIAILLISFLSIGLNAAIKIKKETLTVPTSVTGEPCKNAIEAALITTQGVDCANLNAANKEIKVTYNPSQISPEQIQDIISSYNCR